MRLTSPLLYAVKNAVKTLPASVLGATKVCFDCLALETTGQNRKLNIKMEVIKALVRGTSAPPG
jgi:hypothetical protein